MTDAHLDIGRIDGDEDSAPITIPNPGPMTNAAESVYIREIEKFAASLNFEIARNIGTGDDENDQDFEIDDDRVRRAAAALLGKRVRPGFAVIDLPAAIILGGFAGLMGSATGLAPWPPAAFLLLGIAAAILAVLARTLLESRPILQRGRSNSGPIFHIYGDRNIITAGQGDPIESGRSAGRG